MNCRYIYRGIWYELEVSCYRINIKTDCTTLIRHMLVFVLSNKGFSPIFRKFIISGERKLKDIEFMTPYFN